MKKKVSFTENLKTDSKNKKYKVVNEFENKMENNTKPNTKRKKKINYELNDAFKKSKKKVKIENIKNVDENEKVSCNISDNEFMQNKNIQVSEHESNKFNGKLLRNSFNSSDGFTMLRKFIITCNENRDKDLATEYLQAGGNILEILRLLDTSENKNIDNVSTVFSAMNIVILKILANYPQNQSSAEEACRHLLNTHLASIYSMLSSQSKVKHRKIILKLLSAVVSLGRKLPRELLNRLCLNSQLLEILVSHSKPTDRQSVRTCFIYFILSFLIEGNASNIRALLEKHEVFSSIFSGLIYDYSDIVQLVLNTVKKFILENPAISKTIKLHAFSTSVIQTIFNLYNWKGPENWPGHSHNKQKLITEHIDEDKKEITVHSVHEFLLTLLTSTRYGIAFHDRSLGTDSKYKHNQLIYSILQSLDKPWEHNKRSELVVKILAVCPDLIKSQLNYAEPFLVPRVSKKWFTIIDFIRQIISNIDIKSCLKLCSIDMAEIQLINTILNLILSPLIIKNAIVPSLDQSNFLIHHEIIKLLLVMIRKVESFILEFEIMKLNISESSTFKNIILEHILKHMPNFETILNVWIQGLSTNKEQNLEVHENNLDIKVKDHLLIILNLLQAYCEICPEIFLTKSSINIEKNSTILLTSLFNMKDITIKELAFMKVKAIKILLLSNMSCFLPNKEIFSIALSFLITEIGNKDISFDLEINQTLNLLLSKCKIFEGYNDQIEIWIDSITYIKTCKKLEVADWMTKIIKHVFKYSEKYASLTLEIEKNTGDEIIDINRQKNIFNELSERNFEDLKFVSSMLQVNSISIFLYAAIENLKKHRSNTIENYVSIVLTHILHCQISLKAFILLIEGLNIPIQEYFISWLNNNVLVPRKKPFKSNNIFQSISRILLNPNEICKIYVNERQLSVQINNDTMNYSLTDFEIKSVFRMVIFYLTQLLQKNKKELENIEVYTTVLLSLLKIANKREISSENLINYCAKWIFKHPIFLQYFKGIYTNNNVIENMITTLFIKICLLFFDLKKQSSILQLMYPYQGKFIMDIKSFVIKNKTNNFTKDLQVHVELIQLLQLNISSSIDLLSIIINLPKEIFLTLDKYNLSIWGIIIHKLIEQFFTEEVRTESGLFITMHENLLKKLFFSWIEIKNSCKQEVFLWENSIYKYLLKFPHSISAIDEKTFIRIMKTSMTPITIKILNLLAERNCKFITTFIKYANNNEDIFHQKYFIFSMLSSNLSYKWGEKTLNKLYNMYNLDIVNFLTEPKTDTDLWIYKNLDAVAYLIENSFDIKVCKEICDNILSNGNKLDEIQEDHIRLYIILFKKCLKIKSDALKDFVQVLLHVTVTSLKIDSKNIIKLDFFCKTMIDSINTLKLENNFTFEELSKNHFWYQFTRISLKLGLKNANENNKKPSLLLKALIATCDVAYKDNTNEEYVKTIFEMTTSHSEFINIMLSDASIKSDLTELLWILIRKINTVMLITHIPLYLASYNATLTKSDQYILKILQHYESNGIKLDKYRPYLWGSSAALHYSVKGETDTALWRQPSTFQVLDLLVSEIVYNTIKNFPIKRNLKYDYTNIISIEDQVYDPAFYLPVFTYLLADHNVIACHKVIHSGALALAIIACSSMCKEVRLAAFTVISRFYFHLEATSSKEKLLWMQFIDSLRNGIFKTELSIENIRINGFVATFLARTSFIMTQPSNPLYSTLQTFLMAKPALDLNTIPEFLQLYFSSDIEYLIHRHWILEIICDGLKSNYDMDIALKCVLFKMLFDFYISTLSDTLTKNLILQIVRSATKLSKSCMILVNGYSLLPWLITVSEHFQKSDTQSIVYILDIVNNILIAFCENKSKSTHHYVMLMKILMRLKLLFCQNSTKECFKNFIDVLNKTIVNNAVCNIITKDQLKHIIDYTKKLSGDVHECELILQFGCKFIKKKYFNCDNDTLLHESLHKLVRSWYKYVNNN